MINRFCFCLWYGPQYRFAYGMATKEGFSITWLEKMGVCDLKYRDLPSLFSDVVEIQGWDSIEGLAMTIISDELYAEEMRIMGAR